MDIFNKIKENFVSGHSEINKVENRIDERQNQIARLERKKSRLIHKFHWTKAFIRPVMDEVIKEFPDIDWDVESFVPMGLCSRVSVFGRHENGKLVMIGFTIGDLQQGELHYDTGEKEGYYKEGSIGSLNGFDRVSAPIESMETLFNHVRNQLEREEV